MIEKYEKNLVVINGHLYLYPKCRPAGRLHIRKYMVAGVA